MGSLPPQGGSGGIEIDGAGLGDMIYHDGTDWVRLAISTNGKILKIVAGIPSWQDAPSAEVTALTDLSDVTITTPSTGQVLRKSGSDWVNATLVKADISDFAHTHLSGDLPANIVYNNQANTYSGGGTQDFGGTTLDNVGILISNATNPATTGVIRLGNNESIVARNNANGADNILLNYNTSDQTIINSNAGTDLRVAGSSRAFVTTTGILCGTGVNVIQTGTVSSAGFVRMANSSLVGWRNAGNTANDLITFNSSVFQIQVSAANEYTFSATEADWLGNNLVNVGYFESNATNPATTGTIRLGNDERVVARNAANTVDIPILYVNTSSDTIVNAASSELLLLQVNGFSQVSFSAGQAAWTAGVFSTYGSNTSSTGTLRFGNAATLGWRNAANSANFTLAVNSSDILESTAPIQFTTYVRQNGTVANSGAIRIAANQLIAWRNQGNTADTWIQTNTSDEIVFAISGAAEFSVTSTSINIANNNIIVNSGASVSSAGRIRLLNNDSIGWRNVGGTGDLLLVANTSDVLTYNGTAISLAGHTHAQSDIINLVTDLSNKQPLDSDLTAIAGLTPTNDDIIQRKSGAWTNRTMAQLKTDLAIVKADISDFAHQSSHQSGGSDALTGLLDATARVAIRKNTGGADVGARRRLNFIEGSNVTLTIADDGAGEEVDITIAASGGGLSDGDKGDITVSSGGTVWTIDNDVVTFGKMQNISTDRLLGRDTAASGDVEELTVGGGIEFTGAGGIQTSAFTGDVIKSAGGTTLTIDTNKVLNTMIRQSAGVSVIGRSANTTGNVADITAGSDDTILRRTASALDFGQLTIGMFPANLVTFAKFQTIATDSLLGRDTTGTGNVENILLNATLEMDGSGNLRRAALTGDITASAGSNSTTIPNNTVTYAKMQDVSATSRFIGRITAGAGDPEELTAANAKTILALVMADISDLSPSTIVRNNQANTYSGSGTQDFAGATLDNVGILISNAATPSVLGTVRLGSGQSLGWRNAANSNDHLLFFDVTDDLTISHNTVSEYYFGSTRADWLGNNLINVGFFEDNATNPSTTGTIRLGNNTSIGWRNAANSADLLLTVNASNILQFNGTTISLVGHTHVRADVTDFAHQSTHQSGGGDALTGNLDAIAKTTVRKNTGADVGSRRRLNFIEGTNVTMTIADDAGGEEVDITINAAAGGGSFTVTQVEVDFGATPVADAIFVITNGSVTASSKIIASVAYDAPTGKDLDELECDDLVIKAGNCSTGQFEMYIHAADGSYLHDKFKINYSFT